MKKNNFLDKAGCCVTQGIRVATQGCFVVHLLATNDCYQENILHFTYTPLKNFCNSRTLHQMKYFCTWPTHQLSKHFAVHLLTTREAFCNSPLRHKENILRFTYSSPGDNFTVHLTTRETLQITYPPLGKHFAVHLLAIRDTFCSSTTRHQSSVSSSPTWHYKNFCSSSTNH